MSDCTDKRFKAMLHHFELGLLSDEEREKFEQHLFECDYCTEQLVSFRRVARLMKSDSDVRAAVGRLAESGPDYAEKSPRRSFFRRFRPVLVPTSLVAVIVFVLLLVKDWRIDIRPSQEAVAAGNRLAVMYFDNLVDRNDPDRLGEIITNLLITDLSESRYVQVVSSQRLYDILRLLGREEEKRVSSRVATEVAAKADSKWMLQGSILQVEPRFVITTQLSDVKTGEVIGSQQVTGEPGEDIFAVVDRLTARIKADLSLPLGAAQETDRAVADVTTHSPRAYLNYLDGLEYQAKLYYTEAVASFRRALEHDSSMAMAYYYLADLEDRELISLAVRYADGVSRKERLYIESRAAALAGEAALAIAKLDSLLEQYPEEKDALFLLGTYTYNLGRTEPAIGYFHQVIAVDPLFKLAYNRLAYAYRDMADLDSSIWAINQYIALAPDEANPYDSRGELYAFGGKLDEAIESYRTALRIKPDFRYSLEKLGHMYVFKDDYETADSCYRELLKWPEKTVRSHVRCYRAYIPLRRGWLDRALAVLDEGLRQDSADGIDAPRGMKHRLKALIYAEKRDWAAALRETERCMEIQSRAYPFDRESFRGLYARLLAQNGEVVRAGQVVEDLRQYLQETGSSLRPYWLVSAVVAWLGGDPQTALEWADRYATDATPRDEFVDHFLLGRIYLDAGRLADAVTEFERQLTVYECYRLYWGIFRVKMHYYLGLAYEESRWYDKAIEQYKTFVDLWSDADPGIEEVEDARQRLTRLTNRL